MTTTSPSETPMLKCGHAANARRRVTDEQWIPCCSICDCIEQVSKPDLKGRQAICCGKDSIRPSNERLLAFFEFRGEGSRAATTTCKHCRYAEIAHQRKAKGEIKSKHVCDTFEPIGPYEYDQYYCGCRGWD